MEENKFIALFSKHWSKILLSLLAIACVIVWGERLLGKKKNLGQEDYLTCNKIFEQFQKGEHLASDSIESAQNILKRRPDLHPKFDALLALSLFSEAKNEEALPYAELLIKKGGPQLPPLYHDYANTTLLIAKSRFEEAFASASKLDCELVHSKGFEKLEAMNTLRLVFLADKLGNHEKKSVYQKKLTSLPDYLAIEALFHEGSVSLADYLKA